ncbi:MAG TPA: hypothetical protein VJL59_20395, partial [Anaerolineales bacterium]|nr:hypothetical protein [Anaerolineales bacterium]
MIATPLDSADKPQARMNHDAADNERALFQMAQSDILWAKGQTWQAANWGLLAQAAVVGMARLFAPAARRWPDSKLFLLMAVTVGLLSGWYIARLYRDMVVSRDRARWLMRALSIDDHPTVVANEPPDATRGSMFSVVLILIQAFGLGVASYYYTSDAICSFFVGLVTASLHIVLLAWLVYRRPALSNQE